MLGFFSFGGGYSFLPLMQTELVEKQHWLTRDQFILSLTAGQISPGPVAVAGSFAGFIIGYNIHHTYIGGITYAFLAWVGTNTATILCMGIIMKVYKWFASHPVIPYILEFLMPVVIGLIFYLTVKMGSGEFSTLTQVIIAVLSFALALSKKIDYALIIIGGGILGYFLL
jgi:chromate transporter